MTMNDDYKTMYSCLKWIANYQGGSESPSDLAQECIASVRRPEEICGDKYDGTSSTQCRGEQDRPSCHSAGSTPAPRSNQQPQNMRDEDAYNKAFEAFVKDLGGPMHPSQPMECERESGYTRGWEDGLRHALEQAQGCRWVDVRERLPDLVAEYWCLLEAKYQSEAKFYGKNFSDERVTHWLEGIPKPPLQKE